MYFCKLLFFLIILLSFLFCFVDLQTTESVAQDCIKDKSKPATGDNVQTCPKNSNYTACCYLNKTWACCPEGDSGSQDLPMIGGILGGITAALIIIVFFWKCCNREQMPCLGKIIDKLKKICPCLDRRSKPQTLTLPKEHRKAGFTDDDFHGGPAWFFSDDPFKTQGRAVPEPPPEADVGHELHKGQLDATQHVGVSSHAIDQLHDDGHNLEHHNEKSEPDVIPSPAKGKGKSNASDGIERMH